MFGDDYGVDYPKEIVINSGVELGATSTSQEALQIDSGLSGGLTITNNGTLSGAGGSAGGGTGGDAFQADVACTFINNGTIRAGGGGGGNGGSGGAGGTGGQGSSTSTGWGSWDGFHYVISPCPSNRYYVHDVNNQNAQGPYAHWRWSCAAPLPSGRSYNGLGPYQTGNYQYEREGSSFNTVYANPRQIVSNRYYYFGVRRRQQTTTTNYHSGGSGGSGGVGQGYNQSTGSGSAGSAGGTNAGAGGSGGGGGSFGNTGSTGSTGANGNFTNGSSGSAAAQPVSTSGACPTSHSRTTALFKVAQHDPYGHLQKLRVVQPSIQQCKKCNC